MKEERKLLVEDHLINLNRMSNDVPTLSNIALEVEMEEQIYETFMKHDDTIEADFSHILLVLQGFLTRLLQQLLEVPIFSHECFVEATLEVCQLIVHTGSGGPPIF